MVLIDTNTDDTVDGLCHQYVRNRKLFGSYWAVCLFGLISPNSIIWTIRYTLFKMVITSLFGFVSTFCVTKIIYYGNNNIDINNTDFIFWLILMFVSGIVYDFVSPWLKKMAEKEQINMAAKINDNLIKIFESAPVSWHAIHSQTDRTTMISLTLDSYSYIVQSTADNICRTLVGSFTMISIMIFPYTLATSVIIICIIASHYILTFLGNKTSEKEKTCGTKSDEFKTQIGNEMIRHYESNINISYKKINTNINPVNIQKKRIQLWKDLGHVLTLMFTYVGIIQEFVLLGLCSYLYFFDNHNVGAILFIVINKSKIFGLSELVSDLKTNNNIQYGRFYKLYEMMDNIIRIKKTEIILTVGGKLYNTKLDIEPFTYDMNSEKTFKIIVPRITIMFDKLNYIMLNGAKGYGKSTMFKILAGLIPIDLFCRDDIKQIRWYVRQNIALSFVNNSKEGLSFNLHNLFPGASSSRIMEIINVFKLNSKVPMMPNGDIDLHCAVNSKGNPSGGETQSFIIASNLYHAFTIDAKILLLDEPEHNIDLDTIKQMLEWINKEFKGAVIMTTHNTDFQRIFMDKGAKVWKFNEPSVNNGITSLKFTIQ